MHHLCLRSGEPRALFSCLEDLEDSSVSECSTVPQMKCCLAVSFTIRPGNHDANEGNQPGLRAVTQSDNSVDV